MLPDKVIDNTYSHSLFKLVIIYTTFWLNDKAK